MAFGKRRINRTKFAHDDQDEFDTTVDFGVDPYDTGNPDGDGLGDDADDWGERYRERRKSSASTVLIPVAAVIAVIAVIYLLSSLIFWPTSAECRKTVATAQSALNDLDATEFCDVIDPSVGRKIKVLIIAGSALTNTDMSSYLMDSLTDLGLKLGNDSGDVSEDMLQNVSFEVSKISFPSPTRTVTCCIKVSGTEVALVKLQMKKKAGAVYISKIVNVK